MTFRSINRLFSDARFFHRSSDSARARVARAIARVDARGRSLSRRRPFSDRATGRQRHLCAGVRHLVYRFQRLHAVNIEVTPVKWLHQQI